MSPKTYALVSGIIFALVAIAHAWRLYTGAAISFNESAVPLGPSWAGLIVAGILAFFGLRLASRG